MARQDVDTGWRERCGDRLMEPKEAIKAVVRPGDRIWCGGWTSVPLTLCNALAELASEMQGCEILTFLTPFNWDRPEVLEHLRIISLYAGPFERKAVNEGRFDYIPVIRWRTHTLPPILDNRFRVALIPISPPDEEGWCSFSGGVWFGQTVRRHAERLVGEIRPGTIRTGGENRIHISEFAAVAETAPITAPPPIPPRSPETEAAANVICTLVAHEILRDRATVQIGVGDVSAAMPAFMEHLHDIGIHSELIPGGIADLVEKGVVTGKYKGLHDGKVVGTGFAQLSQEEYQRIDGNPAFELYDFTYTDDIQNLLRLHNFFAINNALAVDLTGNVCAETMGTQIYSGPGGQTVFAFAAATTNNASVTVLPSSQVLSSGERVSRIVPILEPGSMITVHRGYTDYVVTEQGIARLTGKTIRQRIDELISVAHPDFRGELRAQARKLYGVG